jgi:glyoxylase I family protein
MDFPAINGFSHIDFTVTDVERSAQWWEQVLGFKLVNVSEGPTYKVRNVLHPRAGGIGFMSHSNPITDRFDERAVGLDHFALRVPDRAALEAWAKHLDDLGIGHSGIQEETGGTPHRVSRPRQHPARTPRSRPQSHAPGLERLPEVEVPVDRLDRCSCWYWQGASA